MLDKEATRVSKEYAGMIALPTVGLAIVVFVEYLCVLFLFSNDYFCLLYTSDAADE